MTFLPIDTGTNAAPNNIVDANELNDRFFGIVDSLQFNGYLGQQWMPLEIDGISFDYNGAKSITSDSNLTALLQEGDKITFEQDTDGEFFGWISYLDWDSTVAGKTYIELIIGTLTVKDEPIISGTVGLSRAANPWGWPKDPEFGKIEFTSGASISTTSSTISQLGSIQIGLARGRWLISAEAVGGVRNTSGAQNNLVGRFGLSTSTSSISFGRTTKWWRTRVATASSELRNLMPWTVSPFFYSNTSAQIIYLTGSADSGTETFVSVGSSIGSTMYLRAIPAYK